LRAARTRQRIEQQTQNCHANRLAPALRSFIQRPDIRPGDIYRRRYAHIL
jgi:hypothetical protein